MKTIENMDISKKLNEQQQKAVLKLTGPMLVLAGAGSGKTRCVTYRIVNLLQNGISPEAILGLTFTNKAAKEMKERVGKSTRQHVLISTFHSLGVKILRQTSQILGFGDHFTIYDEDDAEKLLKACLKELNFSEKKKDAKLFRSLISEAKNNVLDPDHIDSLKIESEYQDFFPSLYRLYQNKLLESHAVDFDDLLYLPVKLFLNHPEILKHYQERWQFLLVDEYQDTNEAQYRLVKLLAGDLQNLFVVGDPDQSIYSWRGAKINNILNFESDFPGAQIVYLEQNYRSTQTILEASNQMISHNFHRYDKKLWSALGQGDKIQHFVGESEHSEARFVSEKVRYYHEECNVPLSDIVIFYRTNFQSRVFEDHLLRRSIPYVIVGGISFYQRKEIKDVVAYLRMVVCPSDYVSFARTINLPKRGIGAATVDKICQAAAKEKMSLIDFCKALVFETSLQPLLKLTKRQKEGLTDYISVIDRLISLFEKGSSIDHLVSEVVIQSGYVSFLKLDLESFEDRKANIDELIEKAKEWSETSSDQGLNSFLEEMALKSTLDEAYQETDRLNLMTLHNSKGLEFEVVFIVGVENELLPHANSRKSYDALEEERRLFYVGMTRAKKYLYISSVLTRHLWGQQRVQKQSRFIDEIPSEYIEQVSLSQRASSYKKQCDSELELKSHFCYKPGDAVFHKTFGVGMIQRVYQGSLGEMVDVFFSNENRLKSLAVQYAKLKKI